MYLEIHFLLIVQISLELQLGRINHYRLHPSLVVYHPRGVNIPIELHLRRRVAVCRCLLLVLVVVEVAVRVTFDPSAED